MFWFKGTDLKFSIVNLSYSDVLERLDVLLLLLENRLQVFSVSGDYLNFFCCVTYRVLHVFLADLSIAHFTCPHLGQLVVEQYHLASITDSVLLFLELWEPVSRLGAAVTDTLATSTAIVTDDCWEDAAAEVFAAKHAILWLQELHLLHVKDIWQVVFIGCVLVKEYTIHLQWVRLLPSVRRFVAIFICWMWGLLFHELHPICHMTASLRCCHWLLRRLRWIWILHLHLF